MINLIRKDILVNFSNKRTAILLLMYVPFISFVLEPANMNNIFLFSTFTFCYMMTNMSFGYEIKDKPHIFIQSLPIRKKDIVIGKYLSIFANFIMGTIYSLIYMWIISLIGLVDVDKIDITIILSTLALTIVSLSISLPTQFRFSPKVANFLNIFIYIIILNDFIANSDMLLRILNLDLSNISNILLVISGILALYLISMTISIVLYNTRKFY